VTGYHRGESGLRFRRLVIGKKGEGQQLLGLRSSMQLTRGPGQAHSFSGSVPRTQQLPGRFPYFPGFAGHVHDCGQIGATATTERHLPPRGATGRTTEFHTFLFLLNIEQ
jgi:hypothetical protein